jgi:magnesium-transporting ATPase (P-type)
MVERMLISVGVMGGIGFLAFEWMLKHGWSESSARNVLLLLMVLFENFHIGNCRSETKSAFALSPLRSPILLLGALAAFLIHLASMYLPFMQSVLGTEPVSLTTWLVVIGLSVSVVPAVELHKWWANRRNRAESREEPLK